MQGPVASRGQLQIDAGGIATELLVRSPRERPRKTQRRIVLAGRNRHQREPRRRVAGIELNGGREIVALTHTRRLGLDHRRRWVDGCRATAQHRETQRHDTNPSNCPQQCNLKLTHHGPRGSVHRILPCTKVGVAGSFARVP